MMEGIQWDVSLEIVLLFQGDIFIGSFYKFDLFLL